MAFNENTRVKIPAILHLRRLGYGYLPLVGMERDEETNIFTDVFNDAIARINPSIELDDIKKTLEQVSLVLDNEDLGMKFYEMLIANSGIKLIDFEHFQNNSFHVVTELTYKNGEEEFRPDITVLINGMPLAFIEVKKPNNKEGVLAERDRINSRFKNKKFRKFINISQLLVFSNNMEYDEESIVPIQGAFYGTPSYSNINFNCFREESNFDIQLDEEDENMENHVLSDNNFLSIKHSPEFITNKNPDSPTNRVLTSLFSKDRIAMILKYAIAYVNGQNGIEKHIMRYPQLFATKQIEKKLNEDIKKGIIWHTQGSGKTALAYYNVGFLTDYFSKRSIVPKFYFIVDRIDLMTQAKNEFSNRGLVVHTVDSKSDLIKDFKISGAIHNFSGKPEITVVNIQKFEEDNGKITLTDYDINTQRIYFLDEVHRSYNPKGSFLASLISSDRNAITIGLTGTPLISKDRSSKAIFGDYIHKYYYNASIADGYTLKLIREGIETGYRLKLEKALKDVEILKGEVEKKIIYSHPKFVEPMLDYILEDFISSRIRFGDNTIGGMVVCDSSDQAKMMKEYFDNKYQSVNESDPKLTSALILHDVGTKEERKDQVDNFKAGKIDLLFVYNMLLTGFDSPRLKKLYLGRVIKSHNLLQTLTRVNRPYKNFRYGYVVDFADIRNEFDATNKAYFNELQEELGDEFKTYSNIFKSDEEIQADIDEINESLFHYDLENSEIFSQQINQIEDKKIVLGLKKALEKAKDLYNIIRLQGNFELIEKLDFKKLNELYNEVSRHLQLLNLKDSIQNNSETTNILNVALEDVLFMFKKISEDELVMADKYKDLLRKTRESLLDNFDPQDPQFVLLYDELKRLLAEKNLEEISQDEMIKNMDFLQQLFEKISELNRKNNLLKSKYSNDPKFARVHKRIVDNGKIIEKEGQIFDLLSEIKKQADQKVLNNVNLLNNEEYFHQMISPMVISSFESRKIRLDLEPAKYVNDQIVKEYVNEFEG